MHAYTHIADLSLIYSRVTHDIDNLRMAARLVSRVIHPFISSHDALVFGAEYAQDNPDAAGDNSDSDDDDDDDGDEDQDEDVAKAAKKARYRIVCSRRVYTCLTGQSLGKMLASKSGSICINSTHSSTSCQTIEDVVAGKSHGHSTTGA